MNNLILSDFVLNLIRPYLGRFASSPGLIERIEIFCSNLSTLAAASILGVVYIFAVRRFPRHRTFSRKLLMTFFLFFPWFVRIFSGYAYDTSLAAICLASDCLLLFFIFDGVGFFFFRNYLVSSHPKVFCVSNFTLGISVMTIFATIFTALGFNRFVSSEIFPALHFFAILAVAWFVVFSDRMSQVFTKNNLLFVGFCCLPLVPYMFSPAPPDADVTSQIEITGYLLQGQFLSGVYSGVGGENFFIRYPAGFASLSYFLSSALNIRGSESSLLLWIFSFPMLVASLGNLGKDLKLNKVVITALSLNFVITGYLGLHGGQVQEMLAYALSISMILFFMQQRLLEGFLCYVGASILQPMVALPFALIPFVSIIQSLRKTNKKDIGLIFAICVTCIFYLAYVTLGGEGDSIPKKLLSNLNVEVFIKNIFLYFSGDTFNLYYFLLAIPVYQKIFTSSHTKLLYLWIIGALVVDGVFGDSHGFWQGTRMLANFNIIAVWIISTAMILSIIWHLKTKSKLFYFPLVFIIGLLISNVQFGFPIKPVSVFTTHSNIRLGRFIEKNLSIDALIANIRPPETVNTGNGFGFNVRGDSSRNTLYARIGEHQVKNTVIKKRPICDKSHPPSYLICLKKFGVTHVFIDARPGSHSFAKLFPIAPMRVEGASYLFKTDTN